MVCNYKVDMNIFDNDVPCVRMVARVYLEMLA